MHMEPKFNLFQVYLTCSKSKIDYKPLITLAKNLYVSIRREVIIMASFGMITKAR